MSAISASLQKRVLAVSLAMLRSTGKSSNNFANRKLSPFLSLGEHFVKLIGHFVKLIEHFVKLIEHFVKLIEHFVSVSTNSCQIRLNVL